MGDTMVPIERVKTALSHNEPDRVPMFLLLTMHGARELGMTMDEYYRNEKNIAEAQVRMQRKYQNDVMVPYYFAAMEAEMWGGTVVYREDGPANSGEPIIRKPEDIDFLEVPDVARSPIAAKTIRSIELIKESTRGTVPILATAISPFSLPVMQLGFEQYFELLFFHKELFWKLMELNMQFSAGWVRLQIAAGADAVTYFDPVSSPTIIPRNQYLETGLPIASEMINGIDTAVAFHLASGRTLPIMDSIIRSGAKVMSVSHEEDLAECKRKAGGRISLIGNLNGIEMRRWSEATAETRVREAVRKAGPGGGFILSDSHGEIPFQVPEVTLHAIAEAVQKWGTYPIQNDMI